MFRQQSQQRVHQARLLWAPSRLRRVVRNRSFQLCGALIVGVLVVVAWSAQVSRLRNDRRHWGVVAEVHVVVEHRSVGDPILDAIETREVPLAFIPEGASTEVHRQAVAIAELYPGEILLDARVTHDGDGRWPAPGTVGLTLATVVTVPLLEPGSLVDIWTVDSANLSSRRIARHVVVLALSRGEVTVAVPERQVAEVTAASLRPVVVTLVG